MQKHVTLVDLVKSFPTSIYLQDLALLACLLASIQPRTSRSKFDDTNTEDTRFHVGKGLTDLHSAQSFENERISFPFANMNVRHEIRT